ncbi:MAG: PAS domain S-box protein [Promethearchaeota archaeon]
MKSTFQSDNGKNGKYNLKKSQVLFNLIDPFVKGDVNEYQNVVLQELLEVYKFNKGLIGYYTMEQDAMISSVMERKDGRKIIKKTGIFYTKEQMHDIHDQDLHEFNEPFCNFKFLRIPSLDIEFNNLMIIPLRDKDVLIGFIFLSEPEEILSDELVESLLDLSIIISKLLKRILLMNDLLIQNKLLVFNKKDLEEKFSVLFDQSNDGIIIHDIQGNILMMNPKSTEIFGLKYSKTSITNILDLFPRKCKDEIKNVLRRLEKEKSVTFNLDLVNKNGQKKETELKASLVDVEKKIVQAFIRDVTETSKLKSQIDNLARLADEYPDPMFCINNNNIITYANKHCNDLFSKLETNLGKKIPDYWLGNVEYLREDKKKISIELTVDEQIYTFDIKLLDDECIGFYGKDITGYKELEREIVHQGEKFRSLFENSQDAIIIHDSRGVIMEINKKASELLGYSAAEFKKMSVKNILLTPEKIFNHKESEDGLLFLTHQTVTAFIKVISASGELIDSEVSCAIIDKENLLYQMIIKDVSELNKLLKELQQREEQLRVIFDNANIAIILLNKDRRLIKVNRAFTKIFGYEEEDIPIMKIEDLSCPKEKMSEIEAIDSLFEHESRPLNVEKKFINKNGEVIWGLVNMSVVEDTQRNPSFLIYMVEDITKIKQAQQEREESLKTYKTLIETLNDGFTIDDKDSRLIYVNQQFCEMLGYTKEELIGKSILKFVNEESKNKIKEQMLLRRKGNSSQYEVTFLKKDGSKVYAIVSSKPLFDNEGNFDGTFAVITDITSRKELEDEIQKQREFQRVITQISSDLINISIDQIDQMIYIGIETISQYLQLEKVIIFLFIDDDKDRVKVEYEWNWNIVNESIIGKTFKIKHDSFVFENILSNIPSFIHDTSLIFEDESIRQYLFDEVNSSTMFLFSLNVENDSKGFLMALPNIEINSLSNEDLSLLNIFSEIISSALERKNIEEKLRLSEEKYKIILENASDLVTVLDENMIHLYVNEPQMKRLLGYQASELYGKTSIGIIHPDDVEKAKREFEHILNRGFGTGEFRLRHKDGHFIWVEIKGRLFLDRNNVKKVLLVSRDISERIKVKNQLMEINKRLEQVVLERTKKLVETQKKLARSEKLAALGKLSGSVSHELRNPLGVISNSIYFLNLKLKNQDKTIQKHLNIIKKEIKRMKKIITDLLDFSRLKPSFLVDNDLNKVVNLSIQGLTIPDNVEVNLNLSGAISKIKMDPDQIRQVIINLVSNGIDAMPDGGTITISTKETKESVILEVKDTGTGIPEKNLGEIFEPLFTTKKSGIGLGLSIVSEIIEKHGGKIEVESTVGEGTTFIISFPKTLIK